MADQVVERPPVVGIAPGDPGGARGVLVGEALFRFDRDDSADFPDPHSPASFDKNRVEEPAVPGADSNPSFAPKLEDQPSISRVGGKRLFDVEVRPVLDRNPGERKVTARWSQDVHHVGPQLAGHGFEVGIAPANSVSSGALPCRAVVRVAYAHDLDPG
jgi:hypothetical protein